MARIYSWWRRAIPNNMKEWIRTKDERRDSVDILFVSHGAYIVSLIRELVYNKEVLNPYRYRLGGSWNTAVSMIEVSADGVGVLQYYYDIRHLVNAGPVVEKNADEESIPPKDQAAQAGPSATPTSI